MEYTKIESAHDLNTTTWASTMQNVVDRIRSQTMTQYILLPGPPWQALDHWIESSYNALSKVEDPAGKMLYDVHFVSLTATSVKAWVNWLLVSRRPWGQHRQLQWLPIRLFLRFWEFYAGNGQTRRPSHPIRVRRSKQQLVPEKHWRHADISRGEPASILRMGSMGPGAGSKLACLSKYVVCTPIRQDEPQSRKCPREAHVLGLGIG